MPYVLCVGIGMMLAGRFLQPIASRFHQIEWQDVVRLTFQQVMTMAVIVFLFMFAFKDRAMSRLFLGSYFVLCTGMLLLVNRALPRFLSRTFFNSANAMPTLFIGSIKSLERLRGWMASKQALGMQPVGFLTDEGAPPDLNDPPFLGGLADLANAIEKNGVVQVVALEIPQTAAAGRQMLEICQS